MPPDFPLANAKRAAEQHLNDSGLTYTILRPSYFMEVWLSAAVTELAGRLARAVAISKRTQ